MELKKNPNVDPKRNSMLYFQVGLAAVLLLTYVGIELKSEDPIVQTEELVLDSGFVEQDVAIMTMPPAQRLPPPPPPAPVEIKIVENKVVIKETKIEKVEDNQQTEQKETKTADSYGDEGAAVDDYIPDELPFSVIEQVPLFPGCENEPKSRQFDCFQEQMTKHIKKNFNYPDRAMEDNIQGRVQVEYLIGVDGKVSVQRVKGPKGSELLEKEARRIIEKLPLLKPGKQRNKPVKVRHVVPITFKLG
ncbi:energy transducer TonB [Flavobacterium ardleyense]|uniref:Energy transducer TonB n=1 Tax=Flavobacterium ardleyense TaxID=2038737 RepID=A0ABW5ZA43_9FLAO